MKAEMDLQAVIDYFEGLQARLCSAFEETDGEGRFVEDEWRRCEGGGGRTRVLRSGRLFEQAGVNYSDIFGDELPEAASAQRPELSGRSFRACGVSLVLHPWNPYVPTMHANLRFFVAEAPDHEPVWWFGGGMDLTPYYGFEEDVIHWHRNAKAACENFGEDSYLRFKSWCDDYFFLPHREEARGVGGLFFDDLKEPDFIRCFGFVRSVGDHILGGYLPIVERRRELEHGDRQRQFQLYRRGRYVEFNLVYDRGTRFGLQSGGRTESVLMSLPPLARWEYGFQSEEGSPEAELTERFLTPRDWL